jgi:uncharacterized phage protein (TIGR01671 family)
VEGKASKRNAKNKKIKMKFRVWDILGQRMYDLGSNFQSHYIIDLAGRFWNLQNGVGGSECIVMNSAGTIDKSGKDVYEGDIVEFQYFVGDFAWEFMDEEDREYNSKINRKNFRGVVQKTVHSNNLEIVTEYEGLRATFPIYYSNGSRVVGNIYENTEEPFSTLGEVV